MGGRSCFAFDDVADGGLEYVALAVFGDTVEQFCIFGLEVADFNKVVLLD